MINAKRACLWKSRIEAQYITAIVQSRVYQLPGNYNHELYIIKSYLASHLVTNYQPRNKRVLDQAAEEQINNQAVVTLHKERTKFALAWIHYRAAMTRYQTDGYLKRLRCTRQPLLFKNQGINEKVSMTSWKITFTCNNIGMQKYNKMWNLSG